MQSIILGDGLWHSRNAHGMALDSPAAALIVHAFFPYGISVTVFIHHIHGLAWNPKVFPELLCFCFISPWLKNLRCVHYNLQVVPREGTVIHVSLLVLNKGEKACEFTHPLSSQIHPSSISRVSVFQQNIQREMNKYVQVAGMLQRSGKWDCHCCRTQRWMKNTLENIKVKMLRTRTMTQSIIMQQENNKLSPHIIKGLWEVLKLLMLK